MSSGSKPDADLLIQRIYDTALDPKLWPEVLHEVAVFCNARGAIIFELEEMGADQHVAAVRISNSFDPAIFKQYLELHAGDEARDQAFFASRSQMTDRIELVPDTDLSEELNHGADVFERPHMKMQMQYGFKHRAGALLNKDDFYRDRFALQFSIDHGPVTPEDCAQAARIMPHIAKAVDLSRPTGQLQRRSSAVEQAIDQLSMGVCILDASFRAVYRNGEFDRQAAEYGVFRVGNDGRLSFAQDRFDGSPDDLLGHHSVHGKYGARPRKEAVATITDDENGFALCVEIAPLPSADAFGELTLDGYIVYSLDTSRPFKVRTDTLRDLFQLTKSEADVVELLADGLTNQQISDQRNKSIHTINTQVKSVLSKTRAANRTQLIRLTTNLSSRLLPDETLE